MLGVAFLGLTAAEARILDTDQTCVVLGGRSSGATRSPEENGDFVSRILFLPQQDLTLPLAPRDITCH